MGLEYTSLNELADKVHDLAKEKGWYDPPKSFTEALMKVVGELSEAEDEYAHGNEIAEVYFNNDIYGKHEYPSNDAVAPDINFPGTYLKPEGIPVELADVLIRLLDTCAYYGIDIDSAVKLKHDYNKNRSYRHGGKKT